MADKSHARCDEGGIAEDMIGMFVGIDDITDRLRSDGLDRLFQPLADDQRAAGIDDCDAIIADDEADIGNIAAARGVHLRHRRLMRIDARRDLAYRQRRDRGRLAESVSRQNHRSRDERQHNQQGQMLRHAALPRARRSVYAAVPALPLVYVPTF